MNSAQSPSSISLERLVPDSLNDDDATGQETLELHLARYRFASQFITEGRVLDCACGVGYGSALLAENAIGPKQVLGMDIDSNAVAYAKNKFQAPNLEYREGDGCLFDDSEQFDTIVSLETVEHVPEPMALLENFARLLKSGGHLVASVPVTPSVDVNPYHLHDFTTKSFRNLGIALELNEVSCLPQDQPFSPLKIAAGNEARLDDMRDNLIGYYLKNPSAALKRIQSTVVDGFRNKYLTIAWQKP